MVKILSSTLQSQPNSYISSNHPHSLTLKSKKIENQRSMLSIFFPIVLFGLFSKTLDGFMEDSGDFEEVKEYFTKLYNFRFIFIICVFSSWGFVKKFIPTSYILFLIYGYNLLLVASDICTIHRILQDYQQLSGLYYYKTLYLKNTLNYFFSIAWISILFYNSRNIILQTKNK